MVYTALFRGLVTMIIVALIPVIWSVGLTPSATLDIDTPASQVLDQSMVWMSSVSILLGILVGISVAIGSFVGPYSAVIEQASLPPQSLKDHWLLLAEHDPAIAFANGVLTRLDATIAESWPKRKE